MMAQSGFASGRTSNGFWNTWIITGSLTSMTAVPSGITDNLCTCPTVRSSFPKVTPKSFWPGGHMIHTPVCGVPPSPPLVPSNKSSFPIVKQEIICLAKSYSSASLVPKMMCILRPQKGSSAWPISHCCLSDNDRGCICASSFRFSCLSSSASFSFFNARSLASLAFWLTRETNFAVSSRISVSTLAAKTPTINSPATPSVTSATPTSSRANFVLEGRSGVRIVPRLKSARSVLRSQKTTRTSAINPTSTAPVLIHNQCSSDDQRVSKLASDILMADSSIRRHYDNMARIFCIQLIAVIAIVVIAVSYATYLFIKEHREDQGFKASSCS
jgi:hypothetical protein